jgi:basic membrane lipoprotein Med (substrate-binding protein (PBP1-ABC) superfamily)
MQSRRETLRRIGVAGSLGLSALAGCTGGGGGSTASDGGSSGGTSEDTATSSDGTTAASESGGSDTVTAAYVYNEAVSDLGWVHTHEVAREALEEKYDWYETQIVEEVTVSEAKNTFQDLANQGVDVIEAATFGYGSPAAKVVQNNDVYIETPRMAPVEGYDGPRLGYYLGKLEEACYVAGKAAGMLTETNVLGYVMSFPLPSTLTELNALVLGARSVNPDVEMVVRTVNTWYDPGKERSAAQNLVDENADVLGYRTSTPAIFNVAAENDLWAYGYADGFQGTDASFDKYITSRMWDWVPFYEATALAAREGRLYEGDRFNVDEVKGIYYGFEEGGVQLDDSGSAVPSDAVDAMTSAADSLSSGEMTDDDIFADTPFSDLSAYERVSQTSSYVEGIEGEVPS